MRGFMQLIYVIGLKVFHKRRFSLILFCLINKVVILQKMSLREGLFHQITHISPHMSHISIRCLCLLCKCSSLCIWWVNRLLHMSHLYTGLIRLRWWSAM